MRAGREPGQLSCFSGGLCTLSPTGKASVVLQEKGVGGWEGLRNNLSISQTAGRSSRRSANRLEGKDSCPPSLPRRSKTRKERRAP